MSREAIHSSFIPTQTYVFRDVKDAVRSIKRYARRLNLFAQQHAQLGETPKDQTHPVELFALRPRYQTSSPLVLLGGMGSLAGAMGFELACRRFANSREILLLQACSIPDRTMAIVNYSTVDNTPSPECAQIILMLATAIEQAMAFVTPTYGPVDLVVLCNTSHFFLPTALQSLTTSHPALAKRIQFRSLIDSTVETILERGHKKIMALYTLGTRLSRLYANRFEQEGLSYVEATGQLEQLLMQTIYEGVKAFNETAILDRGTALVTELITRKTEFQCIIAGCTEIPLIIHSLRLKGSAPIRTFLDQTDIIDPVLTTLESLHIT